MIYLAKFVLKLQVLVLDMVVVATRRGVLTGMLLCGVVVAIHTCWLVLGAIVWVLLVMKSLLHLRLKMLPGSIAVGHRLSRFNV